MAGIQKSLHLKNGQRPGCLWIGRRVNNRDAAGKQENVRHGTIGKYLLFIVIHIACGAKYIIFNSHLRNGIKEMGQYLLLSAEEKSEFCKIYDFDYGYFGKVRNTCQ